MKDLDKIIDFLSGRLRKEEQEVFAKEKAEYPESKEDALAHQAVLNYIDQSGDLETKDWLKTVLPKYQEKKNKPGRSILMWLIPVTAAAAMLLLFFLPSMQPELSSVQQVANYLEPYELSFGDRGQSADVLLEAGQAYQTKEYDAAIPLLQQAIEESQDGKYRLALGISLLEVGKSAPAIENFQDLISNADPIYTEHAQWYMALAYLQQNNPNAAAPLLQILAANPKAFNHSKAKNLLTEKIFF